MTQSVEKQSRTITVLSPKGLDAAQFVCGCDMFRSLQKFSGEILNSSGQTVRKIKKSDLQKTEYSSNLATDDYVYYYNCNFSSLDRKSTRLNSQSRQYLVCRLLLEKKKTIQLYN